MGVEERFEPREVVRVEVVRAGGEQFAPHRVALGPATSGVAQKRTRRPSWWAADTRERSFSRSAAGMGPAPCQVKLFAQLSLMSGAKEAGAAPPRSVRRPS